MLGDYPVALKEYRAFIRRMASYSNKEINEDSTLYQAIQSSYDFYNNHLKSRDSLTQVDIVNNYLNQYNYWTNFLSDNQNHPGYILRRAEFQVFIHFHIGQQVGSKGCRWICDPFMCGMDKPSFIPSFVIRYLRDLVRYLGNLTNMIIGEKISRTGLPHRVQPQARTICSLTCSVSARVPSPTISWRTLGRHMTSLSLTSAATPQSPRFRPL